MLIFLDTEFTRLPDSRNDGYLPKPELISLGLVTEAGDSLYVESLNFKTRFCSDFVKQTVLPLLSSGPRLSSAALKLAINKFLSAQPENSQIACDYPLDYVLLVSAAGGSLPANMHKAWLDVGFLGREPAAIAATERFFSQGRAKHHALADAEALRLAWQAFTSS